MNADLAALQAGDRLKVTFDMTVLNTEDGVVKCAFDGQDPLIWPSHMTLVALPEPGRGCTVEKRTD